MSNSNQVEQVTRTEFKEWRESKVGEAFFNNLKRIRQDLLEGIAQGKTIAKDKEWSTDYVVGWVRGITEVILTDVEETIEEKREKYGH